MWKYDGKDITHGSFIIDGIQYPADWLTRNPREAAEALGIVWVEDAPVTETPKTYQEHRAENYAPISEQLDMQYWDSVNGTTTWNDHIAGVKSAWPKP